MSEAWQRLAWAGSAPDAHGNVSDTWGEPEDLTGCLFDPGGTSEPGFRNRVVTEPTLYLSGRPAVDSRDRFNGHGSTWEVNGDVADWGLGLPLVVPLRKVEG